MRIKDADSGKEFLDNKGKQYLEVDTAVGGDRVVLTVGNTIIDVMHGYARDGEEPQALISIYAYDHKKSAPKYQLNAQ